MVVSTVPPTIPLQILAPEIPRVLMKDAAI